MTKTAQSERLVPCNIDKYHKIMVELVAGTSSSPHGTVTVLAGRALGKHSHVMDGVSDGEKQDVQGGGGGGGGGRREVRWSRVYHGRGVEKGR